MYSGNEMELMVGQAEQMPALRNGLGWQTRQGRELVETVRTTAARYYSVGFANFCDREQSKNVMNNVADLDTHRQRLSGTPILDALLTDVEVRSSYRQMDRCEGNPIRGW